MLPYSEEENKSLLRGGMLMERRRRRREGGRKRLEGVAERESVISSCNLNQALGGGRESCVSEVC